MHKENNKKLIVVTAPSGSGKTTIVRHLLETFDELEFSVSATTRAKRDYETLGIHYYFLSVDTFRKWIEFDAFVEWEEVYENQYYGTPKFEVERIWNAGKHVIFDIDVYGAMQLRKKYPDNAEIIFIKAPTMDEIERRLRARKTESEESLARRLKKIEQELHFADQSDHILVNDDMQQALIDAEQLLTHILRK